MATGDQSDIAARFTALLPSRWFPSTAPVMGAVAQGIGGALSALYGNLMAIKAQSRLSTAAGSFLDMIAQDFFGASGLARLASESDAAYKARIGWNLTAPRGTRPGMAEMIESLTGTAPVIIEPSQPGDVGGYGVSTFYGATPYGSMRANNQSFITVQRPAFQGAPGAAFYGAPMGGYGVGAIAYASSTVLTGGLTDSQIYASIAAWTPAGGLTWVNLEG